MDKETFEALKIVMEDLKNRKIYSLADSEVLYSLWLIDSWINEVAKDYTE